MKLVKESVTGTEAQNNIGAGYNPGYTHYYPETAAAVGRERIGYRLLKRGMDIVLSVLALIVLSPLMLIVALAIRIESKGPVLFCQKRIGRNQREFVMYKFRSMCQDAESMLAKLQEKNERDGPVFKIAQDPRVTKVGAFLRKTCIDELPQLLNILKGDMSLVGPRPPLPREVEQYTPYHLKRLDITPGLTCYWQISNRNMTFDQWVETDLRYIREQSVLVDISIIIKTFLVVFKVSGDK